MEDKDNKAEPEDEDTGTLLELAEVARQDQGNHEMEVSFGNEAATLLHEMIKCTKNPGHKGFIQASDFTIQHLPPIAQHPFIFGAVQILSEFTVKLSISYTSFARPKGYAFSKYRGRSVRRFGSGFAYVAVDDKTVTLPCTKASCLQRTDQQPHHEYGYVVITTAAHVVFDESEAQSTIVEFFYNSEDDKSSIITARGVHVLNVQFDVDRTLIQCVTRDPQLIKKLVSIRRHYNELCEQWQGEKITDRALQQVAIIASHPHGKCKQISVGSYELEFPRGPNFTDRACYNAPTCRGSSGAPVITFSYRPDRPLPNSVLFYGHSGHGAKGYNEASQGKPTWFP